MSTGKNPKKVFTIKYLNSSRIWIQNMSVTLGNEKKRVFLPLIYLYQRKKLAPRTYYVQKKVVDMD